MQTLYLYNTDESIKHKPYKTKKYRINFDNVYLDNDILKRAEKKLFKGEKLNNNCYIMGRIKPNNLYNVFTNL